MANCCVLRECGQDNEHPHLGGAIHAVALVVSHLPFFMSAIASRLPDSQCICHCLISLRCYDELDPTRALL